MLKGSYGFFCRVVIISAQWEPSGPVTGSEPGLCGRAVKMAYGFHLRLESGLAAWGPCLGEVSVALHSDGT